MPLTEMQQQIVDGVQEHGWFSISVFEDEEGPSFSYTIGLWETLAVPEIVICGLPRKLMHNMLWEAFHQLKSGKMRLEDHARWSGLIEGFDCISRPVHPDHIGPDYFSQSLWYRRFRSGSDLGLTGFQLFWPSKTTGLFPWEDGCSEEVRNWQPLLYFPKKTGQA